MSDCLFCLVCRQDRSLSRSVVLILHQTATHKLYRHWTPPSGTRRAQLPNKDANMQMWKETIREYVLFEIPKTCCCLPGNVLHVRLWVSAARGGEVGGWVVKGWGWGVERAWWQTFVYVFLLVHRFKGQRAYSIEGPRSSAIGNTL